MQIARFRPYSFPSPIQNDFHCLSVVGRSPRTSAFSRGRKAREKFLLGLRECFSTFYAGLWRGKNRKDFREAEIRNGSSARKEDWNLEKVPLRPENDWGHENGDCVEILAESRFGHEITFLFCFLGGRPGLLLTAFITRRGGGRPGKNRRRRRERPIPSDRRSIRRESTAWRRLPFHRIRKSTPSTLSAALAQRRKCPFITCN